MINRMDFQRYLCNEWGCNPGHGNDATLCREVNGQMHYATFGNHARREVHRGEARRFLQDLGFAGNDYAQICNAWGL